MTLCIAFIFGFAFLLSGITNESLAQDSQNGRLTGKVVDAETGEALVGANVILEGTTMGAACDIEGNYRINNVVPGEYTLVFSMIGYAKVRLTAVKVVAGQVTKHDVTLKAEILQANEVVIEAKLLRNTEASLLRDRQRATAVSDAISAETISRAGSGTAADAMEQVTGASVVDNKYVYVRGLGDRYMNTQLNGALLPSLDPYRNAVSVDLFPAKFIENIVTTKTFTPDKPGSFTGGSVNIETKSFPEDFTLAVSSSSSYNSQTSGKGSFLTSPGGDTDWLGIDDGMRAIPYPLSDPSIKIPNIGEAFTNAAKAQELDRLSKAFNPNMSPLTKTAPINQSHSFSIGNQLNFLGMPFGYFGSLSYGRNFSSYKDGTTAQYQLTGKVSEVNELTNLYKFSDSKSSDEVLWGGLINFSLKPGFNHNLQAKYSYNRSGESESRYQSGPMPRDLAPGTFYETRVLKYTERELNSVQLQGEHFLKSLLNLRLDWTGSYTGSTQDEPDLRFFSNDYTPTNRQGVSDTLYSIAPSNYSRPVRYFRNLNEDLWDSYLNFNLPFKQWSGRAANFKFGGAFSRKNRAFSERRFEFYQSSVRYNGDPESFFSAQNMGIVSSTTNGRYNFGNYVVDASQLANNYDGDQDIAAGYAMVDVPLLRNLRFIGGARFETTRIKVVSQDATKAKANMKNDDLLPSVNLVYQIGENMNVRGAYGRTLARPTFRELAPFASFDFVGDFIFIGNANLKRTLVDNYDLRWEWFSRPGEIFAVSGFYKRFENPIERAIVSNNNQGQFQNVDEAVVYGAEFEFRKQLDQFGAALRNFQVGGNLSLIHSEVDIPTKELLTLRQLDPSASGKRVLQGQSPYVLNVDLSYDNSKMGTSASLYYNVFGERLSEVSLGGTPNVFEQPRGALDLSLSQKLSRNLTFKANAKNLLNTSVRKSHTFKGQEFVVQEHKTGRLISISMSYSVE
jgi:outer membrane receptor protein involved in Fe transport